MLSCTYLKAEISKICCSFVNLCIEKKSCIILWTFQNGQYENVEIKICIGLWEIGIGSEYLN